MPTETAIKHLPADLPDHFDGIKQETIVLRHLAGLLELVKLDDASRDTIERSYDRARHVTGLYQNDDMGCLLFASGLFTPSGKRIYIGLCQRDENWHLDCTLRRAPDSREPVGELLLPDGAAPADAFDTLATNLEENFPIGDVEVMDKTAENGGSVTSPDAPLAEMDAEIAENEYSVISPNALLDVMDMEIACYNSGVTSIDGDTAFRYNEFASYFIYPDPDAPSAFRTMLKNNSALRNAYLDRLYLLISALLVDDEYMSFDIENAIKLLNGYNEEENSNSSSADGELSTSVSTPVENPATPSDAGDKSPDAVETPVETEQNSPESTQKEPIQPELPTPAVDYSLPPQSLRDVVIHPAVGRLLHFKLGLGSIHETLSGDDLTALAEDYAKGHDDPARLVASRKDSGRFFYLLLRESPSDSLPVVLELTPNSDHRTDADGRELPWRCNYVGSTWPPEENILPDEPTELHDVAPETAPAPSRLTGAQMQQVYDALVPPFSIGEPTMLTSIAMHLTSRGIFWRAYGYDSALQMLSDLPELFHLSYDPRRESPRVYYVTIQPWPSTSAEAITTPAPEQKADETGNEATDEAEKPPFSMTERLIQFPISQQTTLSRLVNGEGLYDTAADPLTQEQLAEFRVSYDAAVADGNLHYDPDYDCYRFPLTLVAQDGSAVSATLKRSTRPNTAPWYISYIKKERGQGVRPGDRLMNFAYIGDRQEFLRALAEHAEPEQWGFSGKEDDFTILWNYIRYTFYRVEFENKVLFDDEGRFAAFDTGLLSRRFGDPLYAVFEPNQPGRKMKWKFSCFCSTYQEGTRQERNMAAKLSVKPQMPSYFTNIYDTIFDPDAEMQINYEHIFRDNLERFPLRWVHSLCDNFPRTGDILKQIDATDAQITEQKKLTDSASTPALLSLRRRRSNLFRQLGEAVNDTEDAEMCTLFDNMIYNLQGCINKTLMRSRRNHQLAEPCFFPTRNVMSMLLPIRLYRTDTPDLALVLERQKSTVYIGRTVITMAMAYKNARLLRRFTSDWLNNAAIRDDELDED